MARSISICSLRSLLGQHGLARRFAISICSLRSLLGQHGLARRFAISSCLALSLAFALTGCSKEEGKSFSFTLTPYGGQFAFGPVTLTVPVGAVPEPVELTIALEPTNAEILPSTQVSLLPGTLRFERQVDLTLWFVGSTLPVGANADNTYLARVSGGTWKRVPDGRVDLQRWVSAPIDLLGTFGVAVPRMPQLDASLDDSAAKDGGSDGKAPDSQATDGASTDSLADGTPGDSAAADQMSADALVGDAAASD